MSKELICEVFPAWVYHKKKPDGQLVRSAEELEALGKGWVDSPAGLAQAKNKSAEAEGEENQDDAGKK